MWARFLGLPPVSTHSSLGDVSSVRMETKFCDLQTQSISMSIGSQRPTPLSTLIQDTLLQLTRGRDEKNLMKIRETIQTFEGLQNILRLGAFKPRCENNQRLADAYQAAFVLSGGRSDLDHSILSRQMVCETAVDNKDRYRYELAKAQIFRFSLYGDTIRDITDAICELRQVERKEPMHHQTLGQAALFLQHYEPMYLHQARQEFLTAIYLETTDSDLDGQGTKALTLYHNNGDLEYLDKAEKLLLSALRVISPVSPILLGDLAKTLCYQFKQSRDRNGDALQRSLRLYQVLLDRYPWSAQYAHGLGTAKLEAFRAYGYKDDAEGAIKAFRDAQTLWTDVQRFLPSEGLAMCYLELSHHPDNGESARTYARRARTYAFEAKKYTDEEKNTIVAARLQLLIADCYVQEGNIYSSLDHFRESVQRDPSPRDALQTALKWATGARKHGHSSALDAYERAVECLNVYFASYPFGPEEQLQFLSQVRDIYNAPSFALEKGELRRAVLFAENTRLKIQSTIGQYQLIPEMATTMQNELVGTQLRQIARRLIHLTTAIPGDSFASLPSLVTRMSGEYEALRRQWEETIAEIDIPRLTYEQLSMAALYGPIIMLNIDSYRADVLIIVKNQDKPCCVQLNSNELRKLEQLSVDSTGFYPHRLFGAVEAAGRRQRIPTEQVLKDLWTSVCLPVHHQLELMRLPGQSRIWWCPGRLAHLPLHVAGHNGVYFNDSYVSSYIPTITVLNYARQRASRLTEAGGIALLGSSPLDNPLPYIEHEFHAICRVLDGLQIDIKLGATPADVLDAFQTRKWVHISCHGSSHQNPLQSALHLDGTLRLSRILQKSDGIKAHFGFLACCNSADSGLIYAEEFMNLAMVVHLFGFSAVVGTLWKMNDDDAPGLAEDFYGHLRSGSHSDLNVKNSAAALNHAVKCMRLAQGDPHRYSTFIHIGI